MDKPKRTDGAALRRLNGAVRWPTKFDGHFRQQQGRSLSQALPTDQPEKCIVVLSRPLALVTWLSMQHQKDKTGDLNIGKPLSSYHRNQLSQERIRTFLLGRFTFKSARAWMKRTFLLLLGWQESVG